MKKILLTIALLCIPSTVYSEEILSKDFYLLGDNKPVVTTKQEEKPLPPLPQITVAPSQCCQNGCCQLQQGQCYQQGCCQRSQCQVPQYQYKPTTITMPPTNGGPQWKYNAATGEYYRYVSAPTQQYQYQYSQPQRYYYQQPQQYYYYSNPQQYNYSTPMIGGGGGGGGCPT